MFAALYRGSFLLIEKSLRIIFLFIKKSEKRNKIWTR